MKKKLLGILAVSAALMITACNKPAENKSSNNEPNSQEVNPSENNQDVRVAGVSLDRNNVSLKPGAYTRLIATINPANAANKKLFWTSSNPAVAKVDDKGTVTANSKGTATITVRAFDGNFSDTCTVTVENPHAIRVKGGNTAVTVLVPEKAEEDDVVDVRVSYDKERYVLDGVYANGVKCGSQDANFYFVMPGTPVTMEARYHEKPAEVVLKEVNSATTGVFLRNVVGGVAQVGSTVEFALSFAPGLDFDGTVSAKDADGANVALTALGGGFYSFTMPAKNVSITAGTKKQLIPFHIYGDAFEACYQDFKVNGERWNKSFIEYDAEIEITLRQPQGGLYDKYTVSELALCNEVAMEMADYYDYEYDPCEFLRYCDYVEPDEEGYTYNFRMPGHETWFQFVEEPRAIEYQFDAPADFDYLALEVVSNSLYLAGDGIVYGQTIYLMPFTDDDYAIRSMYLEPFEYYNNYYGSGSTSTTTRQKLTYTQLTSSGYGGYKLTLNQRPVGPLTITVSEKYLYELEDDPMVGSYLGVYAYGSNTETNETRFRNSNNKATIAEDGDMTIAGYNYAYYGKDRFSNVGAMYDISDETKIMTYIYENGVFYTERSENLLNNVYKYVYFQKADPADADNIYKLTYANFNSGKVFVGKMFRNNELYQTVYLNFETGEFYTGVEIEMISANEITATTAKYNIYFGDYKAATVSYKGNGGAANRGVVAPDALFGTFTHDAGTLGALVADGLGGLKFGNNDAEILSYDMYTGELKFIDSATDDTYTVIVSELIGVYTFVAKQESMAGDLIGKAYSLTGYCYRDRDCTMEWEVTTYTVEFLSASAVKVTCKIGSTSYANSQNGTFKVRGDEIQVTFKAYGNSSNVTWKFNFANDLSSITLTEDSPVASVETSSWDYFVLPIGGPLTLVA